MTACIECAYYGIYDGCCMNPVSERAWEFVMTEDACKDFEPEVIDNGPREENTDGD